MWMTPGELEPTLSLNIVRSSPRQFFMSMHHSEHGFIASNEQLTLPESSHRNLQDALNKLTNPHFAAETDSFSELGWLLFKLVLPERIQETLANHTGPIVLVTEEMSLPWELFHTGEEFLSLKQSFSRQVMEQKVVGNLLGTLSNKKRKPKTEANVLLIANPTGDLDASVEEAESLQELFESNGLKVRSLIGPQQCDYLSLMGALKHPYEIIHFSGHTESIKIEDSFTSMIPLAGGHRLLAEDIRRCLTGQPVVFLNSCHSSDIQAEIETQPLHGAGVVRTLAQAFTLGNSAGQSQAIIGSMWWISDSAARDIAASFYEGVLKGKPIGDALKTARLNVSKSREDPALWGSYVLFGHHELQLSLQTESEPSAVVSEEPLSETESIAEKEAQNKSDRDQTPIANTSKSNIENSLSFDAEELPWAEEVHSALLAALVSVSAMNWNIFTSFHLIMGLTYVDKGMLRSLLTLRQFDPDKFRKKLRKALTQQKEQNIVKEMQISANVDQIFAKARGLAASRENVKVQEKHLLVAMLQQANSSAQLVLRSLGITEQDLGEKVTAAALPQPAVQAVESKESSNQNLFDRTGALELDLFETDLQDALRETALRTFQTNWSDIRSPHLFLGIALRANSRLERHCEQSKYVEGAKLFQLILQSLSQTPKISLRIPKLHREFLSQNALGVLRKAQQLSLNHNRKAVTERDVLEVILSDESNIVTLILKQLELVPEKLLWPSRRSTSALAVISSNREGQQTWLTQWNTRSEKYHFIGGRIEPGESPTECIKREIQEELQLNENADYSIIHPSLGPIRYSAMSESASEETDYQVYLYRVECTPAAIESVSKERENAWLSVDEIVKGVAADGREVSENMARLIDCLPAIE